MALRITLPDGVGPEIAARAAARDLTPEARLAGTLHDALGAASPLPGMTMAAFEAFIAEGEADVAAGQVVSHAEAMADPRQVIADAGARRGE
ncbi:hypothetical protein [Paracraurococcus ruber]|uniref:Uncharacterized protein n=1 Tax=Paracraurococcus ruber TaxID=77675 RepID=A0ABS1D3M7_9PROT|nr:hypothetical protein [Paracraurococcus ruber]MBK1661056.1 hypothetical protein [Paracraurococcus ruber]TDG27550.1 hypothetical protein E2C05_22510 [Paracraurococcus ruber]